MEIPLLTRVIFRTRPKLNPGVTSLVFLSTYELAEMWTSESVPPELDRTVQSNNRSGGMALDADGAE